MPDHWTHLDKQHPAAQEQPTMLKIKFDCSYLTEPKDALIDGSIDTEKWEFDVMRISIEGRNANEIRNQLLTLDPDDAARIFHGTFYHK